MSVADFMNAYRVFTMQNPITREERILIENNVFICGFILQPSDIDKDTIYLSAIRVHEMRKGNGTKGLLFLLDLARRHQVRITLTVNPFGRGGMSRAALHRWYGKYGFIGTRHRMDYHPPVLEQKNA